MTIKSIAAIALAFVLSAAALAGETHQKRVAIHIDTDGDGHAVQAVRFDSETAGFDLDELQLGESRAFVDEDGNNLFVVRTENGYDFDVNGRKIAVPDPASFGDSTTLHENHAADGQTHIVRKVRVIRTGDDEGTEINEEVLIDEHHEVHVLPPEVNEPN